LQPAGAERRPGPPPLAPWPEPERSLGAGGGLAPPGFDPARQVPPAATAAGRGPARGAASHRAEIGQLVENIPRSMRVSVPAMIEVRVARADVQALAEGLQGGGAAYQHAVMIAKAMSVRLRAPDGGFFIETASPETQWIERATLMSQDDFASWRWHVTPRDAGRRRLQDQVISVRVRTNYGQVASRWIGWGVAAVAGGLLAKFGEGAVGLLGKMISG
jgi:neural Wiskott-Aldrich syndrome protein